MDPELTTPAAINAFVQACGLMIELLTCSSFVEFLSFP
jgi:hypothetical protein